MPLVFEQYVAGAGWQLMFCAPGTAYNHSQCACTDPNPAAFEPPGKGGDGCITMKPTQYLFLVMFSNQRVLCCEHIQL